MEKKHAIPASSASTLEQDYHKPYDLTQYGNSLGYTQFHIVETETLLTYHKKVGTNEMFKYINEHPEYNTIPTTEISYR
jgi:hypothetical protein